MTVNEFEEKIRKNHVSGDANILCDPSWECDPAECSRVFYDDVNRTIVFTQEHCPKIYEEAVNWREL